MSAFQRVTIDTHTTSSSPHLHIVYVVHVELTTGETRDVYRRFSEFVNLHTALKDPYEIPESWSLSTVLVPSKWADDELLAARKIRLSEYLQQLLEDPEYQDSTILAQFLGADGPGALQGDRLISSADLGNTTLAASPIAAAYYPSWSASTNPPSKVNFAKFDILYYAFVVTNASSTVDWLGGEATLKQLVAAAKKSGKGTKIVLSVGGWTGCYYFTQSTSTAANRAKFVKTLVDIVASYGLDGIDIDWEYPNSVGANNPHSANDAANLLTVLKALRTGLGSTKIISAAVTHLPWLGSNGKPLTNVAEYAKVMTYVNIMNYDVNGSSANPGPNAPLGDNCGTSKQPQANARAALAQWKAAGFPASKLVLGLPLYGYVSRSSATTLSGLLPSLTEEDNTQNAVSTDQPPHSHAKRASENKQLAGNGDLSSMWGLQIAFEDLLASGALVHRASDGLYVGANGYKHVTDNCSDTPYLYNQSRTTVVTYDDPKSLTLKAQFAKASGMAGCFTWSMDQDDGLNLQNAIRSALGR